MYPSIGVDSGEKFPQLKNCEKAKVKFLKEFPESARVLPHTKLRGFFVCCHVMSTLENIIFHVFVNL